MELGVITSPDIENEIYSRGITVGEPPPGVTPPPILPPPPGVTPSPISPIVVVPPRGEIPYEPFLPLYPPAVVTPDVDEGILPYIPAGVEPGKGLGKGLWAILGIAAFALVFLGGQEPTPRSPRRRSEARPRRRTEPEEEAYEEDYGEEEVL